MKSRAKFVAIFILTQFLGTAAMSGFLTLIFRDVRRGPLGAYLTGYLWPRFMEFYMIFVPLVVVMSCLLLVGWIFYELSLHEKK